VKRVLGPVNTKPSTGLSPDLTTNARSGKKPENAADPKDTERVCPPDAGAYAPTFIRSSPCSANVE
jgi:hypothetical protein